MRFLTVLFSLLLSISLNAQIPNYVPSNGLVAWYPFNGNANDESGNGNHGLPMNGVSLIADRNAISNSAYNFDGIDDHIVVQNNPIQFFNDFTISVWFKTQTNGNSSIKCLISKENWNNNDWDGEWWIYINHMSLNKVNLFIIEQINYAGALWPNDIADNQWHMLCATRNDSAGSISISIDGGTPVTNSSPVGLLSDNSNIYIGGGIYPYNGIIDDIGIWNRVLTANEILALYGSGCTISQNLFSEDTLFSCGADSVQLNAGSGFSAYAWSNGANTQTTYVSSSGMYYITATNSNGCSAVDSVYVSLINAEILQSDTTICAGDSVTLSVSNSGPLSGTLNQGLVGWWPFNGNANDESGNGNNGTVNGAVLSADRFGSSNSAFIFDGVNDQISVGNSSSLSFSSFTISCWVNKDNQTIYLPGIISKCSPTNQGWYLATTANQNHNLIWQGGGTSGYWGCASSPLNALDWIYLAAVYSPTSVKLFVNGVLIDSNSTQSGLINTTYPLTFGYKNGDSFFGGQIDDIGIWNRVLTNNEILSLYLSGNHQYQWSTGDTTASINVSPAQTTTYYVTITDGVGNCIDSVTVTVDNPQLTLQATILSCGADSVQLNAGSGFSAYAWSNGANTQTTYVSSSGMYYITATNSNGCSAEDSVYVSLINAEIEQGDTTICNGHNITLSLQNNTLTSAPYFQNATYLGLFSSNHYYLGLDSLNWPNACEYANTLGGQLAVVKDSSTEAYLDSAVPIIYNYWIGLTDSLQEGLFMWVDGDSLEYSNWYPGEPNNSFPDQDFVNGNFATTSQWDDMYNAAELNYVFTLDEFFELNVLWSTGDTTSTINVSPAQTTTYYVTITDGVGSCTDSVTVTVNTPTIAVTVAPTDCETTFNGSATVIMSNGIAPYAYSWSNGSTTGTTAGLTIGNYSVTATDNLGCSFDTTITILAVDSISPIVNTQHINVYLDASGNTSITAAQIDNGSSDNCAIDTIYLDQYSFTCADSNDNVVTLSVVDVSGNSSTATAIVTVLDTLAPTVATQNITVYLDASGNASITAAQIDNGSSDNCAIDTIYLDQYSFTCVDSNANVVTLSVVDVSGNSSSATAIVTVLDTLTPTVATQNITVYLDASGNASITGSNR